MKVVRFRSSVGKTVSLGTKLSQGGEGAVYDVSGEPNLVAKLYHNLPKPEAQEKLRAMVVNQSDALLKLTAWPTEVLLDPAQGAIRGFLMRKATGHKDVLSLYSPRSRLAEFPDASWKFLVHAAANVARIFHVMHECGHVIGDVNHGNLMVSPRGTAVLIDCDSFQVRSGGRTYLCPVGVPTYTPPELQGVALGGITRTPNHDTFGLAVLIFHLLFMGRHPFSGQYLGNGEMPIEKAIREFRFAYSTQALKFDMKPPPGTMPMAVMPQSVALLFERAFSPGGVQNRRPHAREWIDALTLLDRELLVCPNNANHSFWRSLTDCPWCRLESAIGFAFFNLGVSRIPGQGAFDLDKVWNAIAAIPVPEPPPDLHTGHLGSITSSSKVFMAKRERQTRLTIKGTVTVLWLFLWFGGVVPGLIGFMGALGVLLFNLRYGAQSFNNLRQEVSVRLGATRSSWEAAEKKWRESASRERFEAEMRRLQEAKQAYQELSALRKQKLNALAVNVEENQKRQFLSRHRIAFAGISGIGPSRIATLQSYGIETALDITRTAVMRIPGFGPSLTGNLVVWRNTVERKFTFNPQRGVDKTEIDRVEREIGVLRQALETQLRGGAAKLKAVRESTLQAQKQLRPHVEAALFAFESVKGDAAALNSFC